MKIAPMLGMALAVTMLAGISDVRAARPKVAIALKETRPSGTSASFGRDGTEGTPSTRAVLELLQSLGFVQATLVGISPAVGHASEGLPVDDGVAIGMARQAGAGVVIVVGIDTQSSGRVRGTPLSGATSTVHVRVLDAASGSLLLEQKQQRGGYGESLALAADHAAAQAVAHLRGSVAKILTRTFPAAAAGNATAIPVSVRGASRWSSITAVLQRLATTKEVSAVDVQEVGSAVVRLSVEMAGGPAALVATLRRTKLVQGQVAAQLTTSGVDVRIQGDSGAVIQVE